MPDRGLESPRPASEMRDDEVNEIVFDLAKLPADSEVRRLAIQIIRGKPIDSIQPLTTALLKRDLRDWRERRVAIWALGSLSLDPNQQDAASNMLLDILEGNRRESAWGTFKRMFKRANLFVALPIFFMAVVHNAPIRGADEFFQIVFTLEIVSLLITSPFSVLRDWNQYNKVRCEAALALGKWRVPEAVGALARALCEGGTEVEKAAAEALTQTLPALTEAHQGILGAESMANLGRGLRHPDTQIAYLILDALEKVGTSHAIPFVERTRRHGRTTRMRDAAERVLTVLRNRQLSEQQNSRLLRPTSGFTPPEDHLLRPAASSSDPGGDRLLRAIAGEHGENPN